MITAKIFDLSAKSAALGAAAGTLAAGITLMTLVAMAVPLGYHPLALVLLAASGLASVASYALTRRGERRTQTVLKAISRLQERLGIFRVLIVMMAITCVMLPAKSFLDPVWTRPLDAAFNILIAFIALGSAGRTIRDAERPGSHGSGDEPSPEQ